MNLIKQNDNRLKPIINMIGCFVRSCGAIAELKAGQTLSAKQINFLWEWAKKNNYIDSCDNVKMSAPIINKAYELLNCKGRFFEIGTFKNGKLNYYSSVGEGLRNAEKWYIQKITTSGLEGTHFRVVDYQGNLIFDPYEPTVQPIDVLYSIIYAYKEIQ